MSKNWMFASSGEIIPPCGVPLLGSTVVLSGILIGAVSILLIIKISVLSWIPSDHIFLINLLWFTLSKNPLISNSCLLYTSTSGACACHRWWVCQHRANSSVWQADCNYPKPVSYTHLEQSRWKRKAAKLWCRSGRIKSGVSCPPWIKRNWFLQISLSLIHIW